MPTDILTLRLEKLDLPRAPLLLSLRPISAADQGALAALYLASYPSGVAAANLDEAQQEMHATFAGEFGRLRPDASATAWHHDAPIGAIMVVEHSIWDEGLPGPFIIDWFVAPRSRGSGAGRALLEHAVHRCAATGDQRLSLRIGPGTSDQAMALYERLGFTAMDHL